MLPLERYKNFTHYPRDKMSDPNVRLAMAVAPVALANKDVILANKDVILANKDSVPGWASKADGERHAVRKEEK